MWWEPRSDAESFLRSRSDALLARYRLELLNGSVVRGVGIGAINPDEPEAQTRDWKPLLLIDERALPELDSTRVPFEAVSDQLGDSLVGWDLAPDDLIEPVGVTTPAVRIGARLHSSEGVATVGLPVVIDSRHGPWPYGFLTVAHGVGPCGSPVFVDLVDGSRGTGTVLFRNESAREPDGGDDIALVGLDPGSLIRGWLRTRGLYRAPNGPPYPIAQVDLYRSQSPNVLGQVTAALRQHGDETWQWLDCWELGRTEPTMQYGDSGSLAIEPGGDPAIFGHFVGGAPARRWHGFSQQWVQDLGQVLARQPELRARMRF